MERGAGAERELLREAKGEKSTLPLLPSRSGGKLVGRQHRRTAERAENAGLSRAA